MVRASPSVPAMCGSLATRSCHARNRSADGTSLSRPRSEGCAKATKEPSFAQAMKLQGTRVAFLNANDYAQFLAKIDSENKVIMTDLGLIKK